MSVASQTQDLQQDQPKVARPNLDHPDDPKKIWILIAIGVAGLLYAAWSIQCKRYAAATG
ncbi:hypothetical protein [uncultured Rhodoblastus sp.]|uniref:hypothetical protein n=1 Tax=uncultured Rhodoblastus sp. TaxID=543037 RepID=UPI0025EE75FF|nr:hypothetical protein [uncultured Rhodoblastus sp.]